MPGMQDRVYMSFSDLKYQIQLDQRPQSLPRGSQAIRNLFPGHTWVRLCNG